jgi:hypothetical protein
MSQARSSGRHCHRISNRAQPCIIAPAASPSNRLTFIRALEQLDACRFLRWNTQCHDMAMAEKL